MAIDTVNIERDPILVEVISLLFIPIFEKVVNFLNLAFIAHLRFENQNAFIS